jgi:hypothetical protein
MGTILPSGMVMELLRAVMATFGELCPVKSSTVCANESEPAIRSNMSTKPVFFIRPLEC